MRHSQVTHFYFKSLYVIYVGDNKSRLFDVKQVKRVRENNFFFVVKFGDFDKHCRILFLGLPKLIPRCLAKAIPSGLSGSDILSFVFGYERQKLQDYV